MVFTIYRHGGHLGHVTWTNYINFRSPFLRMLHMKFGFDLSEEKIFEIVDDGRRRPEHGHPISSPSDELTKATSTTERQTE